MAFKWGMHVPVNISAAVRDDKKSGRPSNVQQLNEISLALQGQQTVQDIVNRATNLFRLMEEAKMVVDHNKNKRIQETLSAIKELFARLRVIYDESNRRVVTPQAENLEVRILATHPTPTTMDECLRQITCSNLPSKRGRGWGARLALITNSRHIFLFTSHEKSTFLRYPKLEVVQNVKNVMLVPFCKTECFDYYEPYEKKRHSHSSPTMHR